MGTSMDIRLDYGAWPCDDGDSTDSTTTCEASPPLFHSRRAEEIRRDCTSRRNQSSALSLSDLLSEGDGSVQDQDLLSAELNAASSSTSRNNSRQLNAPRRRMNEGTHPLASSQTYSCDSPIIDLTESPPQPLNWPMTIPRRTSPQHLSEEKSNMASTLRTPLPSSTTTEHLASSAALPTEERRRKRRRLSETMATAEQADNSNGAQEVEAVDLSEVNDKSDVSKVVAKQQQDAVRSQTKDGEGNDLPGRTRLSSYKCPICMDTPENATSTICGHLFCHKCIIDTLRFSEQQRRDDAGTSKAKGTCPVCRKPLARKDEPGNGRTLVPLELKLSTKRDLKGKAVVGRPSGQAPSRSGLMQQAKTERESSADMWRELTNLQHH